MFYAVIIGSLLIIWYTFYIYKGKIKRCAVCLFIGGGRIYPDGHRQAGRQESPQGGGGLAAERRFSGFLSDKDFSNYQLFTLPDRDV